MKQLIENQMKEFREKFLSENNAGQICWSIEGIRTEMVIDWHKQSLKQFIDGLIAREEKRKSNQKQDNGHDCYDHNCEYCENAIKDNVIEETIAHLKKLKEELN